MFKRPSGESAKILQFPSGGRAGRLNLEKPASEPRVLPVVDVDGWYHDKAIRESEAALKH